MAEKLNDILFHPSTLIKYVNTHLFKVLLFLLFLSTFSLIVPIIDIIKSPGFTIVDKDNLMTLYSLKLTEANELPDCKLVNNEYQCQESTPVKLFSLTNMVTVTVISDVDNTYKVTDHNYYIKLTRDKILLVDRYITRYTFSYEQLPTEWQALDFTKIKAENNPNDAYFTFFLGGFNKIVQELKPYEITLRIGVTYIIRMIETVLFTLFLFLFYGRGMYRFREVFKVTVFASTLSVFLGVILDLLRIPSMTSPLIIITVFYVYIALDPRKRSEEDI